MAESAITIDAMTREMEVPVIIVDQNGIVVFVNRPFEQIFGWSSDEMIGELVVKIIPSNMHDAHNLGFSRFVTTGQARLMNQQLRLSAIGKDGRVFEAEHYIIAEKAAGQWLIGATIKPL